MAMANVYGWVEMEYGSGGDSLERRKRYHRHTANQIQRLELMFKECPHPDEKQRLHLSRELGLAPRQIKFWFQNRRTQIKAQHERADNDKIRCDNIAIREALKNVICPSCGGPPLNDDSYYDDQKLRLENAHLKEELDRVSSIAAKYIGRPISQLPSVQPIHVSSLDLSMASFGNQGMVAPGPSLNLDLLPAGASSSVPNLSVHLPCLSDMDKSLMSDIASNALEELLRLLQTNEPLWLKSNADDRDVLSCEAYERMFPKPNSRPKNPNVRVEASRDSEVVFMNSLALVDIFMDPNKWAELFPTIVSVAKTIQVISSGVMDGCSGSLQLQIEQGTWAVVDVTYDFPQDSHLAPQFRSHRRPSGCLFQDMPDGHCKVTWVDHVEIEDKTPPHRFYRNLIYSGMAFGAERWLATLRRMFEKLTYLMVTSNHTRDNLGGVVSSPEGKRGMMKLAQRMVTSFCASVNRCKTLSGLNEIGVRVSVQNGVVLSAATTIWLPTPPHTVFNFFKGERKRPQWDVLSNGDVVQEVARIANGSHPGNSISVLRVRRFCMWSFIFIENMLIVQESCIDSCGSTVVYCPVDLASINIAMNGEDHSYIPLLPNGFSILPDGQGEQDGDGASKSSNSNRSGSGGSLVTIALQILVSSLPSKLNMNSVANVNNLIRSIIHQIKASFT
ncbi:hypothetical protein Fmac_003588 [Flemingia macrophylla]|uniref:Uncharacterized protein n=1 Tax=Flemingia macrophylla TaxID=520843 RepID=A0ABD1N3U0_9FABA